jgi:hypothetical protein
MIRVVVDVEKGMIQVKQGPRDDIQVLPLITTKGVLICQMISLDFE